MVKRGLFSGLSRASLIALIGAGIVVASVNSSFAGGNDRGQKNQRCRDLVAPNTCRATSAKLNDRSAKSDFNKLQIDLLLFRVPQLTGN